MKDTSKKFNTFYGKHVVLSKKKQKELFEKKRMNVNRLKEGLKEYNTENGTSYKLAEEPIVQGSMAMSTVIQNDENDYDIDVAIVFEKDSLPEGTTATKNIIEAALRKKCTNFKIPPTAKTNCVRIEYCDGYHIDLAIYRRFKENELDNEFVYEHCGSQWRTRNPRNITNWFLDENKVKNYKLRNVVRLLKMFSKSNVNWANMPGGLIQSVLANEKFENYDRLDECFYYTIKGIRDRLLYDKDVYNPVDATQSLILKDGDKTKVNNLYTRLNKKLNLLDVLFEEGCTDYQAIEAWSGFFNNHPYWETQKEKAQNVLESYNLEEDTEFSLFDETEEFIQHIFPVKYITDYELSLDCKVKKDSIIKGYLQSMMAKYQPLIPGHTLEFVATTNVPKPYDIYWKVKNKGEIAESTNCIRGQIFNGDKHNPLTHKEPASFKGNHYVECYIVKDGVCILKQRINVPIRM